jgi:hypothetical protein
MVEAGGLILLEDWNSLGGSITSTTYNKHTKVRYNTQTPDRQKIHRQTDRQNKDRQTKDRQTDFELSSTVRYFFDRT